MPMVIVINNYAFSGSPQGCFFWTDIHNFHHFHHFLALLSIRLALAGQRSIFRLIRVGVYVLI